MSFERRKSCELGPPNIFFSGLPVVMSCLSKLKRASLSLFLWHRDLSASFGLARLGAKKNVSKEGEYTRMWKQEKGI